MANGIAADWSLVLSHWSFQRSWLMEHNPYAVGQDIEPGSTGFPGPKFEASVRTVQIIALALIMGVVTFLGGVLVATASRIDDSPEMITKIAAGFAFLMLVNYFVIPPIIIKAQLKQAIAAGMNQKQDDEKIQKCCGIYQTQLIVGFALLEGAAFFNLVAMMLEHCVASIIVVTLLLLLMAAKFPTRDKVSFWVQDKLRELQL